MPVCDRCNSTLSRPAGYAVWSEAKQGMSMREGIYVTTEESKDGNELGALILCEGCAAGLFSDQVWAKARALTVKIDPDHAYDRDAKGPRIEVINFGVAIRAKRMGLGVTDAKREARRIAELFWQDESTAARELSQQRSSVSRSRPSERLVSVRSAKKWYEFWR